MLRLRLADGLPLAALDRPGGRRRRGPSAPGCWSERAFRPGRRGLTLRGRLLADAVVRDLLP